MIKAQNIKEFVERIDQAKKKNPKDLSSDQDLSIAVMNLISIEEHLIFSGAKTNKNSFFDMVQDIRELRKNLMLQMIPSYEGEVWCISKHLLASSMRLMEVGTKQQSLGHTQMAYDLFNKAYDLYCLFWGLNMNLIDTKQIEWKHDSKELDALPSIQEKDKASSTQAAASGAASSKTASVSSKASESSSSFAKFKAFVRKAVDCCIE